MEEKADAAWDALLEQTYKYNDYEYPAVSVIVPAYNNSEKISLTLDSLLEQHYPSFEVIVVDGGSSDRTLEVVKNYRNERIQIYSVAGFQRYEMLNKGIAQAKGEYLNCLFPGDYYVYPETLLQMMETALDKSKPDLVYCGTLIRDGRTDPKVLLRPLSLSVLKRGQQPSSLQSCWFKKACLIKLGKFDTTYSLRGGFELMCRFCIDPNWRVAIVERVLTDYDLRQVSRSQVFIHFVETFRTIRKYFGTLNALKWLFIQKDGARLIKIWWRSVKVAFLGRT